MPSFHYHLLQRGYIFTIRKENSTGDAKLVNFFFGKSLKFSLEITPSKKRQLRLIWPFLSPLLSFYIIIIYVKTVIVNNKRAGYSALGRKQALQYSQIQPFTDHRCGYIYLHKRYISFLQNILSALWSWFLKWLEIFCGKAFLHAVGPLKLEIALQIRLCSCGVYRYACTSLVSIYDFPRAYYDICSHNSSLGIISFPFSNQQMSISSSTIFSFFVVKFTFLARAIFPFFFPFLSFPFISRFSSLLLWAPEYSAFFKDKSKLHWLALVLNRTTAASEGVAGALEVCCLSSSYALGLV